MTNTIDKLSEATAVPKANRLLRCRKTRRYFNGSGWTLDPSQGETFTNAIDAVRACVTRDLREVELVLLSPDSSTELFSTPIR